MKTAKIFQSGNSQAVRLPKEFQFKGKQVEIFRKGNTIILREIPQTIAHAFELLTHLPDDFFEFERKDTHPQERDF